MEQGSLSFDTKVGIIGGSLLSIYSSIHIEDIEKTVVLGAIGAVVSFIVSLVCKVVWQKVKK
jgi:hypothetical protein